MLHEPPSAHPPWTKTIFGLVVLVVVAFVVVVVDAMSCDASGSIKVLLLSVLAKLEYGVKVKPAISVVVRKSKTTKLVF